MATLKLGGVSTITESGGAVSLDSGVIFPAGTVLQSARKVTDSQGFTVAGTETRYISDNNNGFSGSGATNDWWIQLVAKQDNSRYGMYLWTNAYYTSSNVSGQFAWIRYWMQYDTNSTGISNIVTGGGNAGTSGGYPHLCSDYEDARNVNGISGQTLRRISGYNEFTSSYSAGTTIYFNVQAHFIRSGIEGHAQAIVQEIAT